MDSIEKVYSSIKLIGFFLVACLFFGFGLFTGLAMSSFGQGILAATIWTALFACFYFATKRSLDNLRKITANLLLELSKDD